MREIKVGLLGVGSMGRTHAFAIQNLSYFYRDLPFKVTVAAVAAKDPENARRFAQLHSIPTVCESEKELLEHDELDVIDICTPNIYHHATIMRAIERGFAIYCEKPLCTTAKEAAEAAIAAKRAGLCCGIVFNNRFLLPNMRAKEMIENGAIGDIISFRGVYHHSSATDVNKNAGWKQNRDICGGGVLFDLGSHIIDLIYSLAGEFDTVSGLGKIVYPIRRGMNGEAWHTNADEAFYMIATLKNGASGTIEAGKIEAGTNDDLGYEIYGTRGSLRFSLMEPNWLYYYDSEAAHSGFTRIECCGRYPSPGGVFPGIKAPIGWLRGHIESMYNFLNCVYHEQSALPSFDDAYHVQAVMEAAYRSWSSGSTEMTKVEDMSDILLA